MVRRPSALIVLALLVSGCGSGSPATQPAESMPPAPVAPDGWTSVASFGTSPAIGFTSENGLVLGGRPVAVHASCLGDGTLVVVISPYPGQGPQGFEGAGLSAVFSCGGLGSPAEGRYELTGLPIPQEAVITGAVVEGLGSLRGSAFNVSIEQPSQ